MSSQSTPEAFCLKLNSHQTHVIDQFQKLYSDELMVDCTLSCNDGSIKAHKLVLSACSPYFTSLFSQFTNPYQYPVIILKDMLFQDLKAIIEFMYKGEVTIPSNSLASILESAKALQITGLAEIKLGFQESKSTGMLNNSNKRKKRKQEKNENSTADDDSDELVITDNEVNDTMQVDSQLNENDETNQTGDTFLHDRLGGSEPDSLDMEHHDLSKDSLSNSNKQTKLLIRNQSQSSSQHLLQRSPTKVPPNNTHKQNLRQLRIEKTAATGNLSGRKMWTEEETKCLVKIWEEESARVWASAGKKTLSLQRISDLLEQENIDRDVSQVEGKIKALKRDYKQIKFDKAIPAVQQRMAPYLERLDKIFTREDL